MSARRAIVLGVTGCIAAYKAAQILRRFQDLDIDVQVIMTRNAGQFVGSLTFQVLSGRRVISDMFSGDPAADIEHIALTRNHDLLLVAPCTANMIGKFAHGIADDFLSTFYLSMTKPVVLAPAMNVEMWNHPSVQSNIDALKHRGVTFIDPEEGYLACGAIGAGRLAGPERIVAGAVSILDGTRELEGKRILITAGPTIEDIDPVRFISNRSSGKMGLALAEEALNRGARVTLVCGPVRLQPPSGATWVPVRSTSEMRKATLEHFPACDAAILAAAVCDFTPRQAFHHKITKRESPSWDLELIPTNDILAELGQLKKHQVLVGFAAESDRVVENARTKLETKRLDLIVANDITLPESGFDSDFNTVVLLGARGPAQQHPRLSKREVARVILDRMTEMMSNRVA